MSDDAIAARRPLKSRGTWWAAWLSSRLVKWNVSPNAISMVSILFAGVAAAAFIGTRYATSPMADALLFVAAIVGIQGRLLCNLMDGMVAVEGGKRTPSGELFNEVPDRVADTWILVAAGYAGDPAWGPMLGWAAALLAMFTAYIRAVGKAAGANAHFVGPMAKPHRMAALTATAGACVIFSFTVGHSRLPEVVSFMLTLICAGCVLTAMRRLSRIVADLRAHP
jgi:phosphatidylglycerophosphate synthase